MDNSNAALKQRLFESAVKHSRIKEFASNNPYNQFGSIEQNFTSLEDFAPSNMHGKPKLKVERQDAPQSRFEKMYRENEAKLRDNMRPTFFVKYWWTQLLYKLKLKKRPIELTPFEMVLYHIGHNADSIKKIIEHNRETYSKDSLEKILELRPTIEDELYDGMRVFSALSSFILNRQASGEFETTYANIMTFLADKTASKKVLRNSYLNPYVQRGWADKIDHVTVESKNGNLNRYFHYHTFEQQTALKGGFMELGTEIIKLSAENMAQYLECSQAIDEAINNIDNVEARMYEHVEKNVMFDDKTHEWKIISNKKDDEDETPTIRIKL